MSSRELSRREALLLGAAGVLYFSWPAAADARPSCIVKPEQTEGPYFVDEGLNRSDIRVDPATGNLQAGAPLSLTFAVSAVGGDAACRPIAGAHIDVWHCDAQGVYSDVVDPSFNTQGHKFLRGYQRTDASGKAVFRTIYPGWYEGRAVHIHFKIRTSTQGPAAHEFTSQLYFPDSLTDRIHAAAAYIKPGKRMRNEDDSIFLGGGKELVLDPAPGPNGYAAIFSVGVRLAEPSR
jgi:protocatechuate 3,4-dioxygenase beta subunit